MTMKSLFVNAYPCVQSTFVPNQIGFRTTNYQWTFIHFFALESITKRPMLP